MKPQLELVIKYTIDKPCVLTIVFPNADDAANHLGMFLQKFGNEDYTAKFTLNEKIKFTLIPSAGGKGIWFDDLIFSKEDFNKFSTSFLNRELFVVMFGFREGDKLIAVKALGEAWINVRGYEIE